MREELLAQQVATTENLEKTEQLISELEKDVDLIRNREMSDILDLQASIEETEADLAEEEISLLQEGKNLGKSEMILPADTTNTELVTLMSLGKQLDSLNGLIQEEKTEIAKTRRELAQKRAEFAKKRASFGRAAVTLIILLGIAGIAILTLFYYLGRRSRGA
jgi:hypothetical protein